MSVNVKLGNNTINGVDVVKLENADSAGNYIEFSPVVNPVAEENDVELIDYGGTIRYSYTAAEFANLTALPPNPIHEGLTAQGWNWTLSDAKTYVANYGGLVIGQMYVTDDDKTRIYITLNSGLSFYLGIGVKGSSVIEWGDGTSNTISGSSITTKIDTYHTYNNKGDYIIKISSPSGSGNGIKLGPDTASVDYSRFLWLNKTSSTSTDINYYGYNWGIGGIVNKIEFGSKVTLSKYCFSHFNRLETITTPSDLSSDPQTVFYNCYSLICFIFPNKSFITNTGSSYGSSYFSGCKRLKYLSISNNINVVAGYSELNGTSLKKLWIPEGSVLGGNTAIPNNALNKFIIPNLTQTGSIPNNFMSGSSALQTLEISSNVTSIGSAAFSGCVGLSSIKFKRTSPPSISSSNAFQYLPTTCKIYVPSSALSAYKSATNYPSSSTYTYIGY